VDPQISMFIQGWFHPESSDDPEGMRESIRNSSLGYRQRLQQGLGNLIATREMTTEEFRRTTRVSVTDEEDLYRRLQGAYDYVFVGSETPPAVDDHLAQ
jgi:hypothetical protein